MELLDLCAQRCWCEAWSLPQGTPHRHTSVLSLLLAPARRDKDKWELYDLNKDRTQAWLADVLARINDLVIHRLDELLPWNWAATMERRKMAA